MHKAVSKPGLVILGLVCICLLVVAFTRCTKDERVPRLSGPVASPKVAAHLSMLNESPCEWQITFTPQAGGERAIWKLSVDQSLDVELQGGVYTVEQRMLVDDAGPDAMRRFSMQLEAGQVYRWRLITLLTDEADGVRLSAEEGGRP